MIRKAFRMFVNPDAHAEYERRHRPIWEELEATLKDHGVLSYSIFLEPESNELFAYAEIESEERWAEIAQTDVCKRWWAYMKDVMPSNADDSPVTSDLREVFHIEK
jgi:L-rhamnose mutarotase